MKPPTTTTLLDNSRFYVLVSSLLLSLLVAAGLRLQISVDQVFFIRTQQVFGFLSLAYLYVALIVSPLGAVIGKRRVRHLAFARRAIGVSACYFALLHGSISLWGQLGGPGQLSYLPALFRWSLLGGLVTLVILVAMAATSFDKVIRFMTFRRWKWLHRLVYAGSVIVLLHVWMIGTHLMYRSVQLVFFAALAVFAVFEMLRLAKLVRARWPRLGRLGTAVLFVVLWLGAVGLIAAIPLAVPNYHNASGGGRGGNAHHGAS